MNKGQEFAQGVWVALALAIFTGVEFWLANNGASTVSLAVIAIVKAAIIIQYFMHASRLWDSEGGH